MGAQGVGIYVKDGISFQEAPDLDHPFLMNHCIQVNRKNRKPLLISVLLMFGQQFSGMNAIMFYGVTIFKAASVEHSLLAIAFVLFLSPVSSKVHRKLCASHYKS